MSSKGIEVIKIPTNAEERAKLAYHVLDWIEANPDLHKQEVYRCKTGMCFAGWTTAAVGLKWRSDNAVRLSFLVNPDLEELDDHVIMPDGRILSAYAAAIILLGLDEFTVDFLFDGDNTVEDIRQVILDEFGPRP